MHQRSAGIFATFLIAMPALADDVSPRRALTIEDRVAAQEAIEQVYWKHRIWPTENPAPKPPLSAVMSGQAIRAKVEDTLRKSDALATLWHRPITAEQLQAELNRVTTQSRDPRFLQEIFAALGNDPFVIAEVLARQTLADRLIHNWYAFDDRFHGELKARAYAARSVCNDPACMPAMGGAYRTTIWKRGIDGAEPSEEAIKNTTMGVVDETAERFVVTAVLGANESEVTTATTVWEKTSFDRWWSGARLDYDTRIDRVTGEFSLGALNLTGCTPDTWTPTHFAVPDPRTAHSAVWTGSEMIVWGGGLSNTGGRYSPATDSWTPTSLNGDVPRRRSRHTAVWTGTDMIVWGGDGLTGDVVRRQDTGGRYNPSTDSWLTTSTGTNVPTARREHTAVWTGTEMIVWGGEDGTPVATGGRYRPATDTWVTTATHNAPTARTGHTAVWTGTKLIVWGGVDGANGDLNSGGRYNPASNKWDATSTGTNVPSGRRTHTAVWTGTEMIVWGGAGSNCCKTATGGRYNPASNKWSATSTGENVPEARYNHTAVWTGTEMIVWGGTNSVTVLDDGGRYTPSTNSWTETSTETNVPDGRRLHTALWTGTEMIVWGGQFEFLEPGGPGSSGGRYSPSTDSWVPTSDGDQPASRASHTAVWTGAEMVVWGGDSINGKEMTGSRYEPATDSWVATTGWNAPAARDDHTSVWTGTEMIVWGGVTFPPNQPAVYQDTGGRYDPATDTWIATSTGASVPSARARHTAVWTGTQLIVWGGVTPAGVYLNLGGRYDPATDAWTETSTGANVPTGRVSHSAVWSGTEMIVWGGSFGSGGETQRLNTGGRYDPATDTWAPTSTGANNPTARYFHAAVAAGRTMIVWGGQSTDFLNTGGEYDPATDTWSEIVPGAGTPSARRDHTAVWTGTEMIVWGGTDRLKLDTGGRYTPATGSWVATSTGTAPSARVAHTAVWTGTEMIVWGGEASSATASGGRYCVASCATPGTWYVDWDGDGYGATGTTVSACVQPSGYAPVAGDCDDTRAAGHPGAPETCNGLDDDCDGSTDEIAVAPAGIATLSEARAGTDAILSWSAVPGATAYDVVQGDILALRASAGDFATSTTACLADDVVSSSAQDAEPIAPGAGRWHLVRGIGCGSTGSYDEGDPSQAASRDLGIQESELTCP